MHTKCSVPDLPQWFSATSLGTPESRAWYISLLISASRLVGSDRRTQLKGFSDRRTQLECSRSITTHDTVGNIVIPASLFFFYLSRHLTDALITVIIINKRLRFEWAPHSFVRCCCMATAVVREQERTKALLSDSKRERERSCRAALLTRSHADS